MNEKEKKLHEVITIDNEEAMGGFNPMGNLMKMNKSEFATPTLFTTPIPDPDSNSNSSKSKKVITVNTDKKLERDVKTPLNSNMPYFSTYNVPTQLLTQTAMQLEDLSNTIKSDLSAIRAAKTMRNKYGYITDLTSSLGMLYGNKISVAREIESIITNSHRLELNKHKEINSGDTESDEKRLMDYFNAFMNTPMGSIPQNMMPARSIPPQALNSMNPSAVPIVNTPNGLSSVNENDPGYQSYISNMSSAQNSMLQSANPNIETVLVYDQTNHTKWFEVIDITTGAQIPNVDIPADFIRDGCIPDIRNGVARNAKLNKTYKLKLVGTRMSDEF